MLELLYYLIQLAATLIVFVFILLCILVKLTTSPYPNILQFDQEKYFKTSLSGGETKEFPSLTDTATVNLSVRAPQSDHPGF